MTETRYIMHPVTNEIVVTITVNKPTTEAEWEMILSAYSVTQEEGADA